MMKHPQASQKGFTLVELLVVISIILVLATFGITKLVGARRDAQQAKSQDNLSSIYFQLTRYASKKKGLPRKVSGSEFVMAIWGPPYLEKSVRDAEILFDASMTMPELTDDNLDEEVTASSIHWAGRNQGEKRYRVGRLTAKNSSNIVIVCNKPSAGAEQPHQGELLCVLYLSGAVGVIEKSEWGEDWDDILTIGPESPVEKLQGLAGHPDDEDY